MKLFLLFILGWLFVAILAPSIVVWRTTDLSYPVSLLFAFLASSIFIGALDALGFMKDIFKKGKSRQR